MFKLDPQKEQILEWYNQGKTFAWIAKELGEYEQAVSNLIRHYVDVPKRKPYKINEDYFKVIDSVDKAYFFGLIAADGAIVKSGKLWTMTISLQEQDGHLLDSLKFFTKAETPIRLYEQEYRGKDTEFYRQKRFVTANQTFCKHLMAHKITPRKSKTLESLSQEVNKEFIPDFIRGFFDGNGSITQGVTSGTQLRNYVTFRGSEFVLKDIKEQTSIEGGKIFFGKGTDEGTGTYTWSFGAKKDVKKFKDMIYHDNIGDLCLSRKKEKFLW